MQIRPGVGLPVQRAAMPAPPPSLGNHPLGVDSNRARLFDGAGRSKPFPTDGSVFAIGREDSCAVVIEHERVSRQHAYGCWQNGQLWIRDNSTNGTSIDGERIPKGEWKAMPEGASLDFAGMAQVRLGVAGSHTVQARLDQLLPSLPDQHLRLADGRVLELPLDGSPMSVGRDPRSDVHLPSSRTSSKHAQLRWHQGSLEVLDSGSTNGTTINGQPIPRDIWVKVGSGSRLGFGPSERSAVTVESKNAPLLVTFFGDGSVPDIGGQVKAQPRRFERAFANHRAPAMLRGAIAQGNLLKDLGMTSLPLMFGASAVAGLAAIGAAGAGLLAGSVALAPLGVCGLALAAAGGFGAKMTRHFLGAGVAAIKDKLKPQPHVGTWQNVQHHLISAGPSSSQFNRLWQENIQAYPQARHVVFISGHGNQSGAAGLKFSEVGATVRGAEAIFLDSCNGAQLESLTKLADSARVAVASEHPVRGYGFPLDAMFGRSQFPSNPRDLGAALVQSAHQSMPAESLVAVDLHVMKEQLMPALDGLGQSLLALRKAGHGKAIRQALKESLMPQKGFMGKSIDLGSFLANLSKHPQLRSQELVASLTAFDRTVLTAVGHGTISFDPKPGHDMPPNWRKMLAKLA
ncbi:MAG: FHA domain-containing protein [Vulcanimicrobiota bacterium]